MKKSMQCKAVLTVGMQISMFITNLLFFFSTSSQVCKQLRVLKHRHVNYQDTQMKRTTHKPRHQPTQTNHDRKQPRQQTNRDSKRKGDPKIGLKANYRTIVCGIAACATCLRRCRQLYMTNVCGIAAYMLLVCGTAALCYLSAALPPLVVFGSIYNPSPGPASFEPWANPACGAWVTSQMIRSMTVQPLLRSQKPRQQKSRIGEPAGDEAQNISSPMSDRQTLRFREPSAHGLLDDSFAPSPTDSDRALTWPVSPSLTPAMSEDQSRTAALAEPDNGSKEPNLVFVKKEPVFAALEVESTATPGSASADDAGHVQFDDMASLFSGHDASAPAAEHDDGPPPSESRREYDDVASVSSALALDPKLPLCTKCRMPTEVLISLSLSL